MPNPSVTSKTTGIPTGKKQAKVAFGLSNPAAESAASLSDTPIQRPTAAETARTFSDVFWDAIFSASGYRKEALGQLREADVTPDVVELVERDLRWTDPATIHRFRRQLQDYIDALRILKQENAKEVRSRPFVDQKRYEFMRSREATCRMTPHSIKQVFERLDFSERSIDVVDNGVVEFASLTHLTLSRNRLRDIAAVPRNVRVLLASGNEIAAVSAAALESTGSLYVLGLSSNALSDVAFLLSCPSLVTVDISYNPLTDLDHLIEVVAAHPTIRNLNATGCPLALLPGYRRRVISACARLKVLDDVPCTADATSSTTASEPSPPVVAIGRPQVGAGAPPLSKGLAAPSPRGNAAATGAAASPSDTGASLPSALAAPTLPSNSVFIHVTFVALRGIHSLYPVDDTAARAGSADPKKSAAAPAAKKGAAKVDERPTPTAAYTVSLRTDWASNWLCIDADDIEASPVVAAEDGAAKPGAKGQPAPKKSPAAMSAAAAAASELLNAPAVAEPEVPLRVVTTATIDLESLTTVQATQLMDRNLEVQLTFSEYTVAPPPSSPSATSGTSPSRTHNYSYALGGFAVPIYPLLCTLSAQQLTGSGRTEVILPLRQQRNTVAAARDALAQAQRDLQALSEQDAQLDALVAEMVAADLAAGEQASAAAAAAAQAAAAAGGKGVKPAPAAGGKQQPQAKTLSDATIAKQQESVARKALLEEMTIQVRDEERRLDRLASVNVSLVLQVALNTAVEPDKPVEPVQTSAPSVGGAVAGGAAKKK